MIYLIILFNNNNKYYNIKIKNSRYINEKMIIIINKNKNIIYYIILNKTLFCKLKKKLSFNNINNL